ncbi:MAG: hypothetical protein CMO01_18025 [Thalassobius sp.]|nr:hypothetical protein [Thalassovita sp.]
MVQPEIFETAFIDDTVVLQEEYTLKFNKEYIGEINLPTGKLVIGDPISLGGLGPFNETFPTGKFIVEKSVVDVNGMQFNAFVRIVFSDEAVVKWEYATMGRQKKISIFDEQIFGYPVDGGSAIIGDFEGVLKFNGQGDDLWDKNFGTESSGKDKVIIFEDYNMIQFSTGVGDGNYGAFVGFDMNDKPVQFLTDFAFVTWWENI